MNTGFLTQLPELQKTASPDDDVIRNYAWSYFAYHAEQRMKMLNLFFVVAGLSVGGLCTLLRDASNWLAVVGLGGTLSALSFIFLKLDQRNTRLIEYAKEAIKYLDSQQRLPPVLQIVSYADKPQTGPSYAKWLKWVFILFVAVGIGFMYLGVQCRSKNPATKTERPTSIRG